MKKTETVKKTVETKKVETATVKTKAKKITAPKMQEALTETIETPVPVVAAKPLTFVESMIKDLTPVTLPGGRVVYKGDNELTLEVVGGKLYNKGVLREGMRVITGSEVGTVTMVSDSKAIVHTSVDHIISRTSEIEVIDPLYKVVEAEAKENAVKTPSLSGRKQAFEFNGGVYSKSVVVREIVAKYVNDNPKTSLAKVEKTFACTFMGKLGIVKELSEAKKLSGTGTPRYFFKPEMLIKVGTDTVAVCNQMTADRIALIIVMAETLGYTVTEQK